MNADYAVSRPDGSRVVFQPGWGVKPTILYCSRENLESDSTAKITGAFRDEGFDVWVYQAPYEVEARNLDLAIRKSVPPDSIAFRTQSLLRVLAVVTPAPYLIVGHSSGARLASLVADQCDVRGSVLFGYPFRSPAFSDEPDRYAHLAKLKKPCLIVQGLRDEYGGREIAEQYSFAPSVRLKFVDSDHGLDILAIDRAGIFRAIQDLIEATSSRAGGTR